MRSYESPSSINLYYQCPRRYFYQYHLKLPTKKSIHLVRGSIVHSCCEKFYKEDLLNYEKHRILSSMHTKVTTIFAEEWRKSKDLRQLNLEFGEIQKYLHESLSMMANFVRYNYRQMSAMAVNGVDLKEAWHRLKPTVEKEIFCKEFGVRGYIDAIQNGDGKIRLLDYKTSKSDTISPEYYRQLSIYSLMHETELGSTPHKAGILFLKYDQDAVMLDVDAKMIEDAKNVCSAIKECTKSKDIEHYPRLESGLCKWSSGQCDFYEECIGEKRQC